jgi:hypothetical protein
VTVSSFPIGQEASTAQLRARAQEAWEGGDPAEAFALLRRAVAASLDLELLNDFGVTAVDALGDETARAILRTVLAVDPMRSDAAENLALLDGSHGTDPVAAEGPAGAVATVARAATQTILLGSFCNQPVGVPTLAVVEPATFAVVPLRLDDAPECVGVTGLAADDTRVYAALQGIAGATGRSGIAVLDRATFALEAVYELPSVVDIHSLAVLDGLVYAVSTGTNELVSIALRPGADPSVETVWSPDPTLDRADHHHLNAVGIHRGELLVSGFGRKDGDRWTSARHGFLFNVTRGHVVVADVAQPHSIVEMDGALAYCASLELRVETADGRVSPPLEGYARGLCVVGGKLFAGTSRGRRVSKSTGQLNHGSAEGEPAGVCTIARLSGETLEIEATATLSALGHELYELLPLTVGTPAP